MIWPIATAVIVLIFFFFGKPVKLAKNCSRFVFAVNCVGITAVAIFAGVLFSFFVGTTLQKEWLPEPKIVLLDIGEAFVFDGERYYFYYETSDNDYAMGSLPMSEVTVFEENRKDAIIQKYNLVFKNKNHRWFGFIWPKSRYDFFIKEGKLRLRRLNIKLKFQEP